MNYSRGSVDREPRWPMWDFDRLQTILPRTHWNPAPQGLLPLPALVSHSTLPSVLANITLFIIPSKPVSNSNCLSQQPPSSQRDLSPSRFPLWYRNVSFPASYPRDRAWYTLGLCSGSHTLRNKHRLEMGTGTGPKGPPSSSFPVETLCFIKSSIFSSLL